MKKILIGHKIPEECLKPYEGKFNFTVPDEAFSYEDVLAQIQDFDAYFVMASKADKAIIDKGTKLKAIANFGVGYDNIDWQYATEKGIAVINTPQQVQRTTAEHTFALIVSVMRGIACYDRELRQGIWNSPLFSDKNTEIAEKTLGIVGLGRIGKRVCRMAQGMGMKVIYYDKIRLSEEAEREYNVTYMEFDDILKNSDCITVHVPYIPENYHMFNKEAFQKMKPDAYFINASRGLVVNEKELAEALRNHVIKGAGLDVFEKEPNGVSPELLSLDNITLTPHAASCTLKSRKGMCAEALRGITAVLNGEKPANIVNPEVLK